MKRPRLLVGRVLSILDAVRGSYWFLPMVMAIGAGGLAIVLLVLDDATTRFVIDHVPWIASIEPDGARALLSVIASTMITVTGVVFSITVVALTLASSQFGPRLLRNFLRDRANQVTFGTFVGTFLYSLIVLRTVREDQVPSLASALAVVFVVVSVFVLIYFIHHTASSMQASTIIAAVSDELEEQLPSLFPERLGEGAGEEASREVERVREAVARDGTDVVARSDGFIRIVDPSAVLGLAVEHDVTLVIHRRPGDFVCARTPLVRVHPRDHATDDLRDALAASFVLGKDRTGVQDLRFLTGQLTEIALRALSPGVNDPRTAVDCVWRLGAVVFAVVDRAMPAAGRRDDDGHLRVITPATTFEGLVASCFDPIRSYGAGHPSVVRAALESLGRTARCCPNDRMHVLARHVREIHAAFLAKEPEPSDRSAVDHVFHTVMRRLERTASEPSPAAQRA